MSSSRPLPPPSPLVARACWLAAGAWTLLVALLCLKGGSWVADHIRWLFGLARSLGADEMRRPDLVAHLAAFGVLGLLHATALGQGSWRRLRPAPVARWGGLLLALGALLEGAQHWIPGRTADWTDLLANWGGTSAGLVLPLLLARAPGGGAPSPPPLPPA